MSALHFINRILTPQLLHEHDHETHDTILAPQTVHLVTTCGWQSKVDLERIVDQPLERGQSANHEDTGRQTVPETAETDVAVDPRDSGASALPSFAITVELRDHDI